MIRGSEDGIVVALVVGAPLVAVAELALTITESEDIAVRLFVAVGLIVWGAVVESSVFVGTLVGGSVTEVEGAVTAADRLEEVSLVVPLVALFVAAVPEAEALVSVLVGSVLVFVGSELVFVSEGLDVPVLVFVGPVVPVLVSVGTVFVLVFVGLWVLVSVGV